MSLLAIAGSRGNLAQNDKGETMKNETIFSTLPVGAVFFDFAYSGMMMQKINHESARFEDGLIGLCKADTPVIILATVQS